MKSLRTLWNSHDKTKDKPLRVTTTFSITSRSYYIDFYFLSNDGVLYGKDNNDTLYMELIGDDSSIWEIYANNGKTLRELWDWHNEHSDRLMRAALHGSKEIEYVVFYFVADNHNLYGKDNNGINFRQCLNDTSRRWTLLPSF